jgi:cytochrome c oxidase cbb3-type subunit 3
MRSKDGVGAAALIGLAVLVAQLAAQAPPPAPAPPEGGAPQAPTQGRGGRVGRAGGPPGAPTAGGGGQRGATFPAQQRAPGDPAVIARGKTLYGINCQACHGVDLRGGDQGGPNLLRSPVVLSDKEGELIVPIIHGSRQNMGMDPINLSDDDAKAVADYLHSVAATMQGQGGPPRGNPVPPNEAVLVGNATAGQAYFASKCSSCHSVTGDLKGIGARYADPRMLQNNWVGGGDGGGRGGGGAANSKPVTVTVTPATGAKVEGRLVRIDDFIVIVELADNTQRSFRRNGDVPKVEVHDPLDAHKTLLTVLNDKDMHDVTAYLASIK